MFNINRFAKDGRYSQSSRDEIYRLKEGLISRLLELDLREKNGIHQVKMEEKICYGGHDSGKSDPGEKCDRCIGDGVYQKGEVMRFVVFRFDRRLAILFAFAVTCPLGTLSRCVDIRRRFGCRIIL